MIVHPSFVDAARRMPAVDAFIDGVKRMGVRVREVSAGDSVRIGTMTWTFVWPDANFRSSHDNDLSLVVRATHDSGARALFVATSKRNLLHGSRRAPAKNGSTSRVMCSSFHTTAVGERPLWTTSIPRRHRSSCNRRPVGASMPIASRRTFHQQPSGWSLAAMERFESHLAKMEGFI